MLWYSLEASHRGTSNEYPQHMFSLRSKKDIRTFRMKKVPYLLLWTVFCRTNKKYTTIENNWIIVNNLIYHLFCLFSKKKKWPKACFQSLINYGVSYVFVIHSYLTPIFFPFSYRFALRIKKSADDILKNIFFISSTKQVMTFHVN